MEKCISWQTNQNEKDLTQTQSHMVRKWVVMQTGCLKLILFSEQLTTEQLYYCNLSQKQEKANGLQKQASKLQI